MTAASPKTKLTTHQLDVLAVIVAGNPFPDPDQALVDLDEVLERCSRITTKPAMQFTIRSLGVNGMIEKMGQQQRRGRKRVVYKPTAMGLAVMGVGTIPAVSTASAAPSSPPESLGYEPEKTVPEVSLDDILGTLDLPSFS